jgi:acetyl-CoA carboxylase beta subunit
MSARESWTRRGGQRPERNEAAPGRAPAVPGPMNAMCRCDRCGAHAYVRVLLRSRQELLFCAHHYRQHAPALASVAISSPDETRVAGTR